jgi:hypothetical protein
MMYGPSSVVTANRPTGIRSSKSFISREVFIVRSVRRGSVLIRVLQVSPTKRSPGAGFIGDPVHRLVRPSGLWRTGIPIQPGIVPS